MSSTLIRNAILVNEGSITETDVYIENGRIHTLGYGLNKQADTVIDARGQYLFPGLIDDQVHFREPGLTHKADIRSESRAAAAGGVTSFMEMPNTQPQTLTQALLEEKYQTAARSASVNYSFFMGASNDNLAEVLRTDPKTVCGIKVFMGSSTGNMLVDDESTLEALFRDAPMLIATHCERESIIRRNMEAAQAKYGEDIPVTEHPIIRSAEACYASSSMAVALARKHNTRLHILHISTAREIELFSNHLPLFEKRITAEACIHHLWFTDADYATRGNFIKWNPAVKTAHDRDAILKAVLEDRIDVIATDHAPHTLEEKSQPYMKAPSGGPLVQHSLQALMDLVQQGKISVQRMVEKACHNPAILFEIADRGYVREGYWADLVLFDPKRPYTVSRNNLLYKCGWSPFEGHTFSGTVTHTWVNGQLVWQEGKLDENVRGQRLLFDR